MPCNAWNHSSTCNCGWGGAWHGNVNYSSSNRTNNYTSITTYIPLIYESFINPNAYCPVCGDKVYFYKNSYGSRVFFDDIGPPWPKHPCTDARALRSLSIRLINTYELGSDGKYKIVERRKESHDKVPWLAFEVMQTTDFRLEIRHLGSDVKLQTTLLKDNIPPLSNVVWISPQDKMSIWLFSYLDLDKMDINQLEVEAFDARKFATLGGWEPFSVWYNRLAKTDVQKLHK